MADRSAHACHGWRGVLWSRLKTLGELRDVALVVTGALYFCGYTFWASYSAYRGFGLMPIADAQYIAAGIVPGLVLLVTLGLFMGLIRLKRWSLAPSTPQRRWYGALLYIVFGVAFAVAAVVTHFRVEEPPEILWLQVAGMAAFYAAIIVRGRGADASKARLAGAPNLLVGALRSFETLGASVFQVITIGYVGLIVVLVPLGLLALFFLRGFPELPQELGGAAPVCVQLDLDTSKLSERSRTTLLPAEVRGAAGVVRSGPLFLVFEGSRHTLVTLSSEREATGDWWKIDSEAITGIVPCVTPSAD